METKRSLSPFAYLDYRKYLADYCALKKNLNHVFSNRLFCRKAGIKSAGYFSEVLTGKRKLSKSFIPKFAKGLDLNEKELAYFELLVAFNHAKTDRAKQTVYELMVKALPISIQRVKQSQLEYFSKWYYVAVRETLAILDMKDDYETLAARLRPPITPAQAKAAVKLLHEMGLIEKDKAGCWRARHVSLVAGGDDSEGLLHRAFQGEMIDRAREALEKIPLPERNISCVTMSVSPGGMERIKGLVDDFHKRILEVVQSDASEDRVLQLNLQIFPLTRTGV